MDCKITENFLKETLRLCTTYINCADCPLYKIVGKGMCLNRLCSNDSEAIAIVQKWSDKHPYLTYLEDFKKKFPNATTTIYRKSIYGGSCGGIDCESCWNEVMPE